MDSPTKLRSLVDNYPLSNYSRLVLLEDNKHTSSVAYYLEGRIRFEGFLRHIQNGRIKITPEMTTIFVNDTWRKRIIEAICMRQIKNAYTTPDKPE